MVIIGVIIIIFMLIGVYSKLDKIQEDNRLIKIKLGILVEEDSRNYNMSDEEIEEELFEANDHSDDNK